MTAVHIARQIRNLLLRNHDPLVKVAPSQIAKGAGEGVFARRPISIDSESQDEIPGTVVCLYPGIFSPGLPPHLKWPSAASDDGADTGVIHLGAQQTPAGLSADDNAYILNLEATGGYLDGACLSVIDSCPTKNTLQENYNSTLGDGAVEKRMLSLTQNPSACGHCVNHSSAGSNVEVVSFHWRDVLDEQRLLLATNNEDPNLFDIPNRLRRDGSPWYLDQTDGTLQRYGDPDIVRRHDLVHDMDRVCGAALVALDDIGKGEEILLNYKLRYPLPAWAKSWYR